MRKEGIKETGFGSGLLHLLQIKCSFVIKAQRRPQDDPWASTNEIICPEISINKCLVHYVQLSNKTLLGIKKTTCS